MDKILDAKIRIVYDADAEVIKSYDFIDENYSLLEVSVIVSMFKAALREWGYKVEIKEERV